MNHGDSIMEITLYVRKRNQLRNKENTQRRQLKASLNNVNGYVI